MQLQALGYRQHSTRFRENDGGTSRLINTGQLWDLSHTTVGINDTATV